MDNECMCNKKLTSYKDTAMRNRLWQEKADELGLEAAVLRTWFDSMRTRFGKLTKTASGDGAADLTKRDKWIMNRFDFLFPHIISIKGRCAGGLNAKLAQQAASSSSSAAAPDDADDNPSSHSHSTTPTPRSGSPQPSSSSASFSAFKAKSSTPSSFYKTALSVLERRAEESRELQELVQMILDEAKKTYSDKHMWGGWLAMMVPWLQFPQMYLQQQQQQPYSHLVQFGQQQHLMQQQFQLRPSVISVHPVATTRASSPNPGPSSSSQAAKNSDTSGNLSGLASLIGDSSFPNLSPSDLAGNQDE